MLKMVPHRVLLFWQHKHLAVLCCILLLAACGPAAVPAASSTPTAALVSAATTPTPAPTRMVASRAATGTPAGPSPEALAYLAEALDYIQGHALRRDRVDWPAVRREALARAQGARTTWETYPAIRYTLAQLQDNHSFLLEPWMVQRRQSATGLRPDGRRLEGTIGYLFLPPLAATGGEFPGQYAEAAVRAIEEADREATCGWVVDLRRNEGGNMWPMVVGVGPILGDGDAGGFVDADGRREVWGYREGQALAGDQVRAQGPAYQLKRPLPPVAVLTGPRTASSGEAIALAFRGRPQARSFGEPTAGVPTANDRKELSDGAWLLLTVARMADRTGQAYEDRIVPDQPVAVEGDPAEWQMRDPERDPVLRAALAWLRDQPDCAGRVQRLSQPG